MSKEEQIISIVKKIKSDTYLKHLLNITNKIYLEFLKSGEGD